MNKYQESLNALALCTTEVEDDTDVAIIQELIDKAEKYRWHDLTKDPNDLPTTKYDMECLVALKTKGGNLTYDVLPDFVVKPIFLDKYKVIAWKLIEPFEES